MLINVCGRFLSVGAVVVPTSIWIDCLRLEYVRNILAVCIEKERERESVCVFEL